MTENQEHAQRWATALTDDTAAVVALFADELVYDDRRDIDHVFDTATTKDQLRERIAPFANKDAANGLGVHRFDVLDVIDSVGVDGARAVAILWTWTGEHLENFRGVPTEGKTLHDAWADLAPVRCDRQGRSTSPRSGTTCPSSRQLGLPVSTPAYWEADFDLSSLAAT